MWLFPLVTLGLVSVSTFCGGVITGLALWTAPGMEAAEIWYPIFLMLVGAVGMWWTVRLTPER